MSRSVSAYVLWNCGIEMQCAYKSNIDARSRNHCHREKAISITYCECESVALVIQSEERMRRIILSSVGLFGSTTLFHIFSLTARFSENILLNTKMRVFFLYNFV